jgi:hypothetical protein
LLPALRAARKANKTVLAVFAIQWVCGRFGGCSMSHQEPISLKRFAEQTGLSAPYLLRLCRAGRVIGARKHVLTKKWVIYPPAKLVPGPNWCASKGGAA